MRTLMKAEFPVEAANRAFDKIEPLLKKMFEDLKPEAAYFYAGNGTRTAMWVIDMKSISGTTVMALVTSARKGTLPLRTATRTTPSA